MPIQAKVGWRAYVSPVTASYLLDSYSGATAAYSLRKLRTTYSGPAIRVRRSSDNTEQNIGFDASGNLDTTALLSFVGAGSGMVTLWYDQSLNVKDAVQTTASNQPQVVINGVLVTQNGMPSVYFNQDILFINRVFSTSNFSAFVLTSGSNGQTDTTVLAQHNGTPDGGRTVFISPNNDLAPYDKLKTFFNNGTSYAIKSSTSVFNGSMSLINVSSDGTGNTYQFVNSSMVGSLTGTNWTPLNTYTTIGNYSNNATSNAYVGYINEIVLYTTNQLSNRSGIESNINAHYSIYSNVSSLLTSLYAAYNADTTASSSLKTSLVASYNGESNTNDSFGSNNGTANGGLTYTAGKIGNAFNGNGTNAYVSLGNDKFNFTGNFSISGWINLNSVSGNQCILSNLSFVSPNVSNGFLLLMRNQKLYLELYQNNNTYISIASNTNFNTSTWYHISIVRVASQSTKIYINGVLDNSNSSTYNPTYSSSIPIPSTIGAWKYDSTNVAQYTNGKIDALNIWQKELTASEVSELYNSGNGAQYIGDNFYKPTPNDALNTYNGTAQGGLTYGLGKVGTAFQFNGTNSFIKYPANSMSFTGDFSISVWVNIGSGYIGSDRIDLLTNITMPYWYNSPKGFWFYTAGQALSFSLSNGTTTDSLVWNDTQGLIIKGNSGWINIVATRKASTRSNIYVNGVLKASNTSTFNPAYSLTNQTPVCGGLHIVDSAGVVRNNDSFARNGTKIDGLSVWNKELTATEVTELYNSGNGKQYPY